MKYILITVNVSDREIGTEYFYTLRDAFERLKEVLYILTGKADFGIDEENRTAWANTSDGRFYNWLIDKIED